jgi:hypothetical protein
LDGTNDSIYDNDGFDYNDTYNNEEWDRYFDKMLDKTSNHLHEQIEQELDRQIGQQFNEHEDHDNNSSVYPNGTQEDDILYWCHDEINNDDDYHLSSAAEITAKAQQPQSSMESINATIQQVIDNFQQQSTN